MGQRTVSLWRYRRSSIAQRRQRTFDIRRDAVKAGLPGEAYWAGDDTDPLVDLSLDWLFDGFEDSDGAPALEGFGLTQPAYLDWWNELRCMRSGLELFALGRRVTPGSHGTKGSCMAAMRCETNPSALENRLVEWARIAQDDPMTIARAIDRDPAEALALRRLALRLGGAYVGARAADGYACNPALRSFASLTIAYPVWARPLSTWDDGATSPEGLIASALAHVMVDNREGKVSGNVASLLVILKRVHGDPTGPAVDLGALWYAARARGASVYRLMRRVGTPMSRKLIAALETLAATPDTTFAALRHDAAGVVLGANARDFSRLARAGVLPDHAGAMEALKWLIRFRNDMSDDEAVRILIWACHRQYEASQGRDRAFCWAGRTPQSTLPAAERYFRLLMRRVGPGASRRELKWKAKGWDWRRPDASFAGGEWRVRELRSLSALEEEGEAQGHCVATYARRCVGGTAAIFSVMHDRKRVLTVEVEPRKKQVVQVRGRFNRTAAPESLRFVSAWAREFGLSLSEKAC